MLEPLVAKFKYQVGFEETFWKLGSKLENYGFLTTEKV